MADARKRLDALLERYAQTDRKGFRINLEAASGEWDSAIKEAGIKAAYRHMAARLCGLYAVRFGEEYLYSDACVAYEIEYHTDAYMCALGRRGYRRNLTSFLFSRASLKRHCRVIDISVDDVYDWRQRAQFRYRRGVRERYRRTEKDPFFDPAAGRRAWFFIDRK